MSSSQQNNTTSAMALPEGAWQTIFSFSGPKAALNCVNAFSKSAKAHTDHADDAAENTSIMWVERQLRASHSATQRAKHLQDGENSPNNRRAEGRELIWESWEYLSDLRCFDALVRHHHSDDQGSALVRMLFSAPVDVSDQQTTQQTTVAAACYPQVSLEAPMANSAAVDRSVVKSEPFHQFSAAASQSSATPPIATPSESSEVPFHCESEAQQLRRRSSVANKKNPSPPTITRRIEVSAETPTSVPPHAGNTSEMRLGLTSASISLSATPQHQVLSVTTSSTQRKRAKKAQSFALSELPVKEDLVFEESSTTPRDNMVTVARLRVLQTGPAEAHSLPAPAIEREACFIEDEMQISCSPDATSPCRMAGVVTSKVDGYADQDGRCSPSCAHHASRAGDDTAIEHPLKAQDDNDPTLDCLFNWTQTATWLEEATTGAHLSIHRLLRGVRGLVRSRLVLDAVVDRKDRQITAAQRTAPVQWQHNIRMRTEALAWLFTLGSRMHLTIPVLADAVSVSDACLWSSATTATSYADMLKMLSTAVVLAGGVHGWSERHLGQTMSYLIDAMEAVGLPRVTEEDLVRTERVMAETMDVRPYVVVRNYQHMVQRWIEATADGMSTPASAASAAVAPAAIAGQASTNDIEVLFGQQTAVPSTASASTTPVKKAAVASASAPTTPTLTSPVRRAHRSPVTARVLEGRSSSVLAWASVADFKTHSKKLVNAMEMKLVAPLPSMDATPPATATGPAMMTGAAFTPAATAEPLLAGITGTVPSESTAAKQSMKRPRSMESVTRPAPTRVCAQHRSEQAEAVLQHQAIETARAQCDELIHYTEAVVLSSPQTLFAHMLNLMPREVADAHAPLAVRLMIQLMHDFPLYQYVCPAVQALACIRILLDVDAACPVAAANASTPRLGPNEMFLHVVGLLDLCGFDIHAHDVMSTVLSVAAALRARCCPEPSANAQPAAAVDVPMM